MSLNTNYDNLAYTIYKLHIVSMEDTKLEYLKHSHGEFLHVPHKDMQYNINLCINPP